MGQKAKNDWNLRFLAGILVVLVAMFVVRQYLGSVYFQEKDRITVAVFSQPPFVYSYNVKKELAFVVFFDADYELNVPGGYGWYKLGSIGLLGKIEKRRPQLLRLAFAELIGSPINAVYYPKTAKLLSGNQTGTQQVFSRNLKLISGNSYQSSLDNYFDRLFLRRIFAVRPERLIVINTTDLARKEKGKWRYDPELLDSRLKGLFYRDSYLRQGIKAVLETKSSNYHSAVRLLRQVEGMGIKVIEIAINDQSSLKQCRIETSKSQQVIGRQLAKLWGCGQRLQDSQILRLRVSDNLAREFSYN